MIDCPDVFREFSLEDDQQILEYIVANDKYDKVDRDYLWNDVARLVFNDGETFFCFSFIQLDILTNRALSYNRKSYKLAVCSFQIS